MYKIIPILIMMLNPVYKCHDIFKIELNIKKKMCVNIATFCMPDKLFNTIDSARSLFPPKQTKIYIKNSY